MSKAQKRPRRAPSLMIVKLTGPTGTESSRPKVKPTAAARMSGVGSAMSGIQRGALVVFLFFDFVAHLVRDARADEAIEQIDGENEGQDEWEYEIVQNEQQADEDDRDNHLREGAPRFQVERLERRIFDFTHHHQ